MKWENMVFIIMEFYILCSGAGMPMTIEVSAKRNIPVKIKMLNIFWGTSYMLFIIGTPLKHECILTKDPNKISAPS